MSRRTRGASRFLRWSSVCTYHANHDMQGEWGCDSGVLLHAPITRCYARGTRRMAVGVQQKGGARTNKNWHRIKNGTRCSSGHLAPEFCCCLARVVVACDSAELVVSAQEHVAKERGAGVRRPACRERARPRGSPAELQWHEKATAAAALAPSAPLARRAAPTTGRRSPHVCGSAVLREIEGPHASAAGRRPPPPRPARNHTGRGDGGEFSTACLP